MRQKSKAVFQERIPGEWYEQGPIRAETVRNEFRSAHSLPDDHPAKTTLVGIEEGFLEALELPNEWLPPRFRDRKNKRRSIRFLRDAMVRKTNRISRRNADKVEKADRIVDYRQDVAINPESPEIRFREDEIRIYNAHLRFCRVLGLVTQEDIDG